MALGPVGDTEPVVLDGMAAVGADDEQIGGVMLAAMPGVGTRRDGVGVMHVEA